MQHISCSASAQQGQGQRQGQGHRLGSYHVQGPARCNGQGQDSGTNALFGAVGGKLSNNNWEAFGMLDGEAVRLTRHTISTALL